MIRAGAPLNLPERTETWDCREMVFAAAPPLHKAIHWNQPDTVRILLEHGADAMQRDAKGRTPKDVTVETKALDCLAVLKSFDEAQSHL